MDFNLLVQKEIFSRSTRQLLWNGNLQPSPGAYAYIQYCYYLNEYQKHKEVSKGVIEYMK